MAELDSVDAILETALIGSGVESRHEALVVASHASLLADGFHLIAVGDEGFESGKYSGECSSLSCSSSPCLPRGWNTSQDVFILQYKQTPSSEWACLVKALPIGDQIVINVVCSDRPKDVVTLSLSLDQYTREMARGETVSLSVFRNILKLFTTLNKEINGKIKRDRSTKSKQDKKTKDRAGITDHDPLRVGGMRRPHPLDPISNPFVVGSGDLSPFGGPGGMIMDPLRQGGMPGPSIGPRPPGFVPPGARYDPVSPFAPQLNPGGRRGPGGFRGGAGGGAMYGPDPDHLPPPGYDDMFS